jgi:uncharacterized ion transporter superfamily protein YfcC
MAETSNSGSKKYRGLVFRAVKALVKAIIFYVIYLLLWNVFAPISEFVPGFQQLVETFMIIYLVLMIIGDLSSGTIYQYFFNVAKALFVIGYLIVSLGGGIFGMTYESISLMIDLRLILAIAVLLGLLGLAKSVLQAVNYMSEKAEFGRS